MRAAAKVSLQREYVERKVGPRAWSQIHLWWTYRSKSGLTHTPLHELAERMKVPLPTAKKDAEKLVAAGLLTKSRVTLQPARKIVTRVVRGNTFAHDQITVPAWIAEKIARMPDCLKHGGDRRSVAFQDVHKGSGTLTDQYGSSFSLTGERKNPRPAEQVSGSLASTETPKPTPPAQPSQPSAPPPAPKLEPKPTLVFQLVSTGDGVGMWWSNDSWEETDKRVQRQAIAAKFIKEKFYAPDIGYPVTPPAPKVDTTQPKAVQARLLANAYRGAIEAFVTKGKKSWLFSRGSIARSKYYEQLLEAADTMARLGIQPAKWCAWSVHFWLDTRKKRIAAGKKTSRLRYPTVKWMFSVKRLAARAELFFEESANDFLPNFKAGPVAADVMARWQAACWRISAGEYGPDVVKEVFPDGFERASRRAKLESERYTAELAARVNDGLWVWGRASVLRETV